MTISKPPSQPGCQWNQECIELCDCLSIYVDEQGVSATFQNPKREPIRKIHFDGCYSQTAGVRRSDFIIGIPDVLDVVVELKGSDTNIKKAAKQVSDTLDTWRRDPIACRRIAALIVYGRIEGKKKGAGRVPRASSMAQSMELDFWIRNKVLLLIRESGAEKFRLRDFLRKSDAR